MNAFNRFNKSGFDAASKVLGKTLFSIEGYYFAGVEAEYGNIEIQMDIGGVTYAVTQTLVVAINQFNIFNQTELEKYLMAKNAVLNGRVYRIVDVTIDGITVTLRLGTQSKNR